jgi:hypothetical protein
LYTSNVIGPVRVKLAYQYIPWIAFEDLRREDIGLQIQTHNIILRIQEAERLTQTPITFDLIPTEVEFLNYTRHIDRPILVPEQRILLRIILARINVLIVRHYLNHPVITIEQTGDEHSD